MPGIQTPDRPLPVSRHRWTVADFHRMAEIGLLDPSDRVELIEGELIDMAPIGSRHANLVDVVARTIYRELPARFRVRVQNPLSLGEISEPQPDITVVRERSYADAHPAPADVLLIVEVSDSTLDYDRDVKLSLYARHGIPEVWLLDVQAGQLTVYREPAEGEYRSVRSPSASESLSPLGVPEVVVRASDVIG